MTLFQRFLYLFGWGRFRWFRRYVGGRWAETLFHYCGMQHHYGSPPCTPYYRWRYEPIPEGLDVMVRTVELHDGLATASAKIGSKRKSLQNSSDFGSGLVEFARLTGHDDPKEPAPRNHQSPAQGDSGPAQSGGL